MKRWNWLWAVVFFLGSFQVEGKAQNALPEIEIIFDASGSMLDKTSDGILKIDAAKQAMKTITEKIEEGSQVGLRVFGAHPVGADPVLSCKDTALVLPITAINKQTMVNRVNSLVAQGQTPIGLSLQEAANDFTANPEVKKTIILISDGEESCGVDPIQAVQALRTKGFDVVIHTIGFDVNQKAQVQLQQIAQISGGIYANASNSSELTQQLTKVAEKAELLLKPEEEEGNNILLASKGTKILSSSKPELAALIDGDTKKRVRLNSKYEVTFAFKENQPILLEGFAYPVENPKVYHPNYIDLFASVEKEPKNFHYIGRANIEKKVFFDNIWQTTKFNVPLRYLKAVPGPRHDKGPWTHQAEWAAYGKYLTEEEFQTLIAKTANQERNVMATEHGGKLIASTHKNFKHFNDGNDLSPGPAHQVPMNSEGIFGFKDGKIALITKIAIPIYKAYSRNPKTIEVWASTSNPTSGFEKVGTFETVNMGFIDNPFQEYVFEQPIRAKFLKFKITSTHDKGYPPRLAEIKAIGTLEP